MSDPIADFMAITDCRNEETAIELLSSADFDVHTAVAMYNAMQAESGAGGRTTTTNYGASARGATNLTPTPPPQTSSRRNDDDDNLNYGAYGSDDDEAMARALQESEYGGGKGSRNAANDAQIAKEMHARDYDHTSGARRMMDDDHHHAPYAGMTEAFGLHIGGGADMGGAPAPRAIEINPNLAVIDKTADFDPTFINKHFGDMDLFKPPSWGCDGRYTYLGDDPSARGNSEMGIEANPIINRFKYCCAIAEKQKKFVFLLIMRGDRTFCDSCCVRDLLSKRSSASEFLKENFVNFFQVVLPDSLEHVRSTQLARLMTHQPDVKRMIHLSAFLSTYQIGTTPSENLLPGTKLPPRVETEEQKRHYNVFCRNAFPVLAVINPQTKSIIKRIPLGQIYRVRNNAAQLDADAFLEELTSALDTNMLGDNFFLRESEESGSFGTPKANTKKEDSAINVDAEGGDTIAKKGNFAAATNAVDVDAGVDVYEYAYDDEDGNAYDVDDDDDADNDNSVEPARAASSSPQTTAQAQRDTVITPLVSPTVTPTPQPPASVTSPPTAPTAASTIDVSKYLGPSSATASSTVTPVPSADCLKLRINTPKGQSVMEFSKKMPVKLFLTYLTALCTSDKMATSAVSAGPVGITIAGAAAAATSATSTVEFTFDRELADTVSKTRFLGGFPPRPLDVDQASILDGIAASNSPSSLEEGVTIEEWGKVRMNDAIRPSLP